MLSQHISSSAMEGWSCMHKAASLTSEGVMSVPRDLSYIDWALWQPGKQQIDDWLNNQAQTDG